jgi:NitT/TauT family transport system ATP-binding protein/nitrate/nitrite transport system substrate-binding protein
MPAQLAAGAIDGFCAGEPWGSHAVALGAGRIALTTGDIWPDHPEKVLAFGAAWVHENRETAIAITAAVMAACRWLDDADNMAEAARIIRTRAFAHLPLETVATALRQPFRFRAAAQPHATEAGWWLRQMRRWGHLPEAAVAAPLLDAWNPSLCRAAAARIGEELTLFSPTEPPA